MNDQHRFDLVALIGGEAALDLGGIDGMTPIARNEIDL